MTRRSSLAATLRPLLSFHDCEEVQQTCALQLHTTGALYRDKRHKLQLSDWVACFRACRAVLRIDRKAREDATDIAILQDIPQTVAEPDRFSARRSAIARRIRYQRDCIAAAYQSDTSRKRKFNRLTALHFLRWLASQAGACGLGQVELTKARKLRDSAMIYRNYAQRGERILETEALADLATRNRDLPERSIKSFSQLIPKRGRMVALAA
jgi:hypothetical protein